MAKKNVKNNQDKRAAKKAAVLETEKKKRTPMFIVGAAIVLLIGGAVWMTQGQGPRTEPVAGTSTATASETEVTMPAGLFEDGKARHFEHVDGEFNIRYFVIKSSDGVVRAAYDACDVCWPAGKGYYQEGDYMVCRNCGRRFASVLVNEVQGGCNPAPLNRKVVDGKVIIQVADILAGKQYFNFKGKAS